ncbi:MAG: sigma-70 family RNA polymerase sigma factor [Planctomycetaceae bacterium]|nr:sigma-70 family RNA polymerase sigma factor [Planctomycetaceae bacterium]
MEKQDLHLLAEIDERKAMIFRLHAQKCNYYGNKYHGDPEDLFQDVFSTCWKRYRNGTVDWESHDNAGLIFKVAKDLCVSAQRRTIRNKQHELKFEPTDEIENSLSEEIAMINERDEKVCDAISALPPSQKSAIKKRYYHGMKPHEIASVCGDKVTTIYKRLDRAKQAIANHCPSSEWLNVM